MWADVDPVAPLQNVSIFPFRDEFSRGGNCRRIVPESCEHARHGRGFPVREWAGMVVEGTFRRVFQSKAEEHFLRAEVGREGFAGGRHIPQAISGLWCDVQSIEHARFSSLPIMDKTLYPGWHPSL